MKIRSLARQFSKRPATRKVRTAPRRLWVLDKLENRLMLASFTDATPALMLTLAANDAVGIIANTSTYTLNLTSGSWSGTNDANVSGSGTATLTVQKAAFYPWLGDRHCCGEAESAPRIIARRSIAVLKTRMNGKTRGSWQGARTAA